MFLNNIKGMDADNVLHWLIEKRAMASHKTGDDFKKYD